MLFEDALQATCYAACEHRTDKTRNRVVFGYGSVRVHGDFYRVLVVHFLKRWLIAGRTRLTRGYLPLRCASYSFMRGYTVTDEGQETMNRELKYTFKEANVYPKKSTIKKGE